ncbi:unnamed protein product [Prorocentrum cordatum]|uniref:Uncharacterized protein n=1 Tax=Prorocentrum cordatum TaxID=2364126 RepID=A0ABN9RXL0_9DINO|nr:unnamed protein product [Polarella glacialis]
MADMAGVTELLRKMNESQTAQHRELLAKVTATEASVQALQGLQPQVAALENTVTVLDQKVDAKCAECMEAVKALQAWMPLMKLLRAHRDWSPQCKLGCSGFSNAITATTDKDVWDLIRVDADGHAEWVQDDCEDWGITADLVKPIIDTLNLL